jgi:hypothetical protein
MQKGSRRKKTRGEGRGSQEKRSREVKTRRRRSG